MLLLQARPRSAPRECARPSPRERERERERERDRGGLSPTAWRLFEKIWPESVCVFFFCKHREKILIANSVCVIRDYALACRCGKPMFLSKTTAGFYKVSCDDQLCDPVVWRTRGDLPLSLSLSPSLSLPLSLSLSRDLSNPIPKRGTAALRREDSAWDPNLPSVASRTPTREVPTQTQYPVSPREPRKGTSALLFDSSQARPPLCAREMAHVSGVSVSWTIFRVLFALRLPRAAASAKVVDGHDCARCETLSVSRQERFRIPLMFESG